MFWFKITKYTQTHVKKWSSVCNQHSLVVFTAQHAYQHILSVAVPVYFFEPFLKCFILHPENSLLGVDSSLGIHQHSQGWENRSPTLKYSLVLPLWIPHFPFSLLEPVCCVCHQ